MTCELTLKDGRVVWDWNARTGTDYRKMSKTYGARPVDKIILPAKRSRERGVGPRSTLAVVVSGLVSCGSPSAPSSDELDRALPGETTTEHYLFRYSQGDRVEPERQERYHEWVVARLGLSLDRRISYYKYRDRSHLSSVTGTVTNGWADPPAFAIHTDLALGQP